MTREAEVTLSDPFVMGVDVARFGDDRSVIVLRRGRDARSVSWIKLTGADTMTVAAKVAEIAQQYRPDAIFIDGGGPGGGVVDRLRQLQHSVFDVQFGGKADHSHIGQDGAIVYANKRAEMWGAMRAWLAGGMIPDDRELLADLTGVEYGYALREGRDAIILEKKEDMKKRGLASPDLADALALTFAYPVAAQRSSLAAHRQASPPISVRPIPAGLVRTAVMTCGAISFGVPDVGKEQHLGINHGAGRDTGTVSKRALCSGGGAVPHGRRSCPAERRGR